MPRLVKSVLRAVNKRYGNYLWLLGVPVANTLYLFRDKAIARQTFECTHSRKRTHSRKNTTMTRSDMYNSSTSGSSTSSRRYHRQAMADTREKQTISVRGEARLEMPPTLAVVRISIVSTHPTSSSQAQMENAEKGAAVMQALREAAQIRVLRNDPSLRPVHRHLKNGQRVLERWEARNTVVFETEELNNVGALIDAATTAGETVELHSINMTLDEHTKGQAKLEALSQAAMNARDKSVVMARQFNARLTRVTSLSEAVSYDDNVGAVYRAQALRAESADEPAAVTPIEGGRIEVTATVHMSAELEHRVPESMRRRRRRSD